MYPIMFCSLLLCIGFNANLVHHWKWPTIKREFEIYHCDVFRFLFAQWCSSELCRENDSQIANTAGKLCIMSCNTNLPIISSLRISAHITSLFTLLEFPSRVTAPPAGRFIFRLFNGYRGSSSCTRAISIVRPSSLNIHVFAIESDSQDFGVKFVRT